MKLYSSMEEYTMKLLSTGFDYVDIRDKLSVPYREGNEITSAKIFAYKSNRMIDFIYLIKS